MLTGFVTLIFYMLKVYILSGAALIGIQRVYVYEYYDTV